MSISIEEVKSLDEFISLLNYFEGKHFFRGQQSHLEYKLLPSILRRDDEDERLFDEEAEIVFYNKFKSRAMPYLNYKPSNEWEWFFLMQHYKTPTRLLDWTESPLVALYFAIDKIIEYKSPSDSPIVWCLDPYKLNMKVEGIKVQNEVPYVGSDDLVSKTIDLYYGLGKATKLNSPLAIAGPFNSTRINAQRGVFTLFSFNDTPLEDTQNAHEYLTGIKININYLTEIKSQLFNLGINSTAIFPELDSISKDIKLEYTYERRRLVNE